MKICTLKQKCSQAGVKAKASSVTAATDAVAQLPTRKPTRKIDPLQESEAKPSQNINRDRVYEFVGVHGQTIRRIAQATGEVRCCIKDEVCYALGLASALPDKASSTSPLFEPIGQADDALRVGWVTVFIHGITEKRAALDDYTVRLNTQEDGDNV